MQVQMHFQITLLHFTCSIPHNNKIILISPSYPLFHCYYSFHLSLGWEDPQEKEMATHSSILAWKIPWTEKPGRLQSMGLQESDTT